MKSTNGQYPNPLAQTPGKSLRILCNHSLIVNVPLWIMPAPKNTIVNVGPKKICPSAAFCNVDSNDVDGKILNIMEYHALAAGGI